MAVRQKFGAYQREAAVLVRMQIAAVQEEQCAMLVKAELKSFADDVNRTVAYVLTLTGR